MWPATHLGFTTPTPIGEHIHADNQQLKFAEPKEGGYDFNYVLNNPGDLDALAASVTDPKSGRTIEMYTNSLGGRADGLRRRVQRKGTFQVNEAAGASKARPRPPPRAIDLPFLECERALRQGKKGRS